MKRQFLLTILIVFTLVVALPQIATAISFEQVSQIAKQTTVLIDGCSSGSGVIFRHEGNNYYVLTAKHVVENAKLTCLVITPDGARQEVDASKTTIPVAGVDLAVVQFTSNQNYQLAQFGDSNQTTPGKTVYVAGAPEPSEAIPQRTLLVVPGNIVGIQSPQSGYSLIYTNPTRRGMSGSPVLNEEGKVIGIHGQGDQQDGGKTGLNLGIPIKIFLSSEVTSPSPTSIKSEVPQLPVNIKEKNENFNSSPSKTTAITKSPNSNEEQFNPIIPLFTLKILVGITFFIFLVSTIFMVFTITDGNILENVKKMSFLSLLFLSVLSFVLLFGFQKIAGDTVEKYTLIGLKKYTQGDYKGAISYYNKIEVEYFLSPTHYYHRANAELELGDKTLALIDYNSAVSQSYGYKEQKKYRCGRARLLFSMGLKQKAISDYYFAIEEDPNYADAYYGRGIVRADLGATEGAIDDFKKAADLYKQQGKQTEYENAINKIKPLENK